RETRRNSRHRRARRQKAHPRDERRDHGAVRDRGGRRLNAAKAGMSWFTLRWIGIGGAVFAAVLVGLFAPAWLHGTVRAVAAYDVAAAIILVYDWTIGL